MFERTIEAQALDVARGRFSPFSLALLVHLAAFAVIVGVSLAIVPEVVTEPPAEPVILVAEPLEYRLEPPAPAPPAPPKRGTGDPGPRAAPQPETPPPEIVPRETPTDLPEPATAPGEDVGEGEGSKGVPDGADDGVEDGLPGGPGGPGDGTGGPPLELTPEMVPPVLLQKVAPDYPRTARMIRQQGRVTVQAVIGLDGSVESVEVLRSSSPLFDEAALQAVRQWRYRPATLGGRPVRVFFTVEVGFVLR